ncbi:MAG: Gfo/Idh/MocA family oxidoreductase [Candidatus Zixiibacteriota bacterium]
MASQPTIGVIGVGHLGAHHVRLLADSPLWHLAGVFDIDPNKNTTAAAQYSLPVLTSAGELLEHCDAVVICTPTDSHFELARLAMERGRHVFVEKPLCASDEQAARLVMLAEQHRIIGVTGHIERFNPAFVAVLPEIVRPRFIEAHRLNQFSPRGLATDVVLELMIHDIDLVRSLVGAEPVEIRASGVPVLSETDDIANCRLAFPDGCVANLTASRISASPMRKLRVFSTDRYTTIDLAQKTCESFQLFGPGAARGERWRPVVEWQGRMIARRSFPPLEANALAAELEDFHRAITTGGAPRVDLREGAASLRVALAVAAACREAARTDNSPEARELLTTSRPTA